LSQFPVITAGIALTSALLKSMLPQDGRKGADQSVTSSTVLQNDTALLVPVVASAAYFFQLEILYKGAATGTGDLKFAWAVPSGATLACRVITVSNPLGVAMGYGTQASSMFSATNGTGNPLAATLAGTLLTSGTPGNLQLQWAQNTSSATATTVMAGSILTARRTS
jgi:hypothetical protein